MTVNILFAALPARWASYEAPLSQALTEAGVDFDRCRPAM